MINFKKSIVLFSILTISNIGLFAGNKDRIGQAGATELNINPWAKSTALFNANFANVEGLESMKTNIAGLALGSDINLGVAYNKYIYGSDISIVNAAGRMKVGESGAIGVNIMSMNFGNPYASTVEDPESNIAILPSFVNISVGYAQEFSDFISGGLQVTMVNESFQSARATGLAIDGGIQYRGGTNNNTHFGIALKNVGPTFNYSGDAFNVQITDASGNVVTKKTPTAQINLPTMFVLSGAYDIYLGAKNEQKMDVDAQKHRLTPMVSFTSNAYFNDYITLAAEYALENKFMFRLGYRYENNIFSKDNNLTLYNGLSAGIGFKTNLNKETKSKLSFDYSYRLTRFNLGVHNISLIFDINK